MEVFSDSVAVFQPPRIDTGYEKVKYVEYLPIGAITDGSVIEFQIPNSGQSYIDFSKSTLRLKVRITDKGVPITTQHVVGFINVPLHSMFSQVDLFLNQTPLTKDCSVNYPYKAYFDLTTNYSKEDHESINQAEGFYRDIPGAFDSTAPGGNMGLTDRRVLTDQGKWMEIEGPLRCDIWDLPRLIPNGVPITVKLWPSPNKFKFMADGEVDDKNYSVEVGSAVMKMCHVTLNNKLFLMHSQAFEKDMMATYPFYKSTLRTFTVPAGSHNFVCEEILNGLVPSQMVVAITSAEAYSGSLKKNPFNFPHHNVNYMELTVDNESVPGKALRPEYPENFTDAYLTYFKNIFFKKGMGLDVMLKDFVLGYGIYTFNVEGRPAEEIMFPPKKGQTRLSISFSKATTEALTIVTYCKTPDYFLIDRARNVIIENGPINQRY